MIELVIRNLDIDVLLAFLQEYAKDMKKVWQCGNMVNGVFVRSELALRTVSEQSITIVVRHSFEKAECELDALATGGGTGLLRIDWGAMGAAESSLQKEILRLAGLYGWEVGRIHKGTKGSGCPFCGAHYTYSQDQVQKDGSVRCQNCNKMFPLASGNRSEDYFERLA
jgi:predicted Zn finger-like uncharacterized protein